MMIEENEQEGDHQYKNDEKRNEHPWGNSER